MSRQDTLDYSKAGSFISEEEIGYMKKLTLDAKETLVSKTGAGNDFLGWIDLPVDYDKEEFARIKAAAKKIQSDSDVLLVIGIGGSYLGARAAIEFLSHSFYNVLPKGKRKTPEIYFVGNNMSARYIKGLIDVVGDRDFSVNVIAKSGTTTEPAIAFRVFKELLEKKYGKEEAAKRIRELYCYDVLRADRCLAANSLEARVPFGDLDFVRYVMSIDPAKKLNTYGKGKYLLRKAFETDHILPENILWREKAAFSDAVGHSMVDDLKEYAEKYYTDEEYETLRQKYDFAQPFTKESLLYREIFEKYYPGQARMVPDFWMPNKSWEGCNVNDPSARVLANYGDSGK